MPRRSPRSRRAAKPAPRAPGPARPRATPGKRRTARKAAVGARARHALQGARPAPARKTASRPAPKPRPAKPGRGTAPPRAAKPPRAPVRRPAAGAPEPERVAALLGILERLHPEAATALHHQNALQLLVATILSAQCTDERVNQVTPVLFARLPDAAALAGAERTELEELIRSTGFYRNKAKAIQTCCADIVARHGGVVPRTMEELTALHGVGRKTANVVLGNAYGIPGLVVDTHVQRLANRLGLTREQDPVKIEYALMPLVPRDRWTLFSHWLILHGRQVCVARKPRCSICPLLPHCPRVGVTASQ